MPARQHVFPGLALFVIAGVSLPAQSDDALARRERSRTETVKYLQRSANEITAQAISELSSRDEWERIRPKRREEMRRMLGLEPLPERTPLNARITGKLDRPEFTVEKLVFESLPKIYVTANLYVPKERPGRVPAVVYVCGHSYSPYGAKTAYQRHGISLAKNGYVAIILDPIQIAETYGIHHGVHSQEMYDWFSRGYTPAGVEVWNAIRAIDYLETRGEVDASKIGMTGRSGGAGMSWFTAAIDDRVKAVMPVMGISTYSANLDANTQKLHCDCMFCINAYRHDMMHQAALIAPRPVKMAHGRLDALFPVPGYTAVEQTMKKLYESYGRGDAFANVVVETDHKDSDFLREESIRWFDRHLLGVENRKLDMSYENAPPESLAVFTESAPKDAQNYRAHEVLLQPAVFRKYKTLAEWEKRRSELLQALRREVLPTVPQDPLRPGVTRSGKPSGGWEELEIESDPGVHVRALVSKSTEPGNAPALIYVAADGEDVRAAQMLLHNVRRDEAVRMIVYPRGVGEIPWDKSTWKDMQRNAMHVGETVDSMRLRDVMAAVAVLHTEAGVDQKRITLMGRGASGVLALYAGVLDTRVEQVTLIEPPTSHIQGPHLLNVIRHTDLPEMAAMMAPRRVNFYAKLPSEFEQARSIFTLYGKPDHMWVTTSFSAPVIRRYHHAFSSGR